MVARIPGEEQFSGIPSARSGRAIARIDESGRARGIEALGRGLEEFGRAAVSMATQVADRQNKLAEFDTDRRFQEFRFNEAQRFQSATQNIDPAALGGFAEIYSAGYAERASEFLDTVPEALKYQYDSSLFDLERQLFAGGAEFARGQQTVIARNQMNSTLETHVLPRVQAAVSAPDQQAALNAIISDGERLIDANSFLSPAERDAQKRAWREQVQRAFLAGLPADEWPTWLGTEPVALGERIVQAESDGDPNATNPYSSAYGLGQFIEGTWLGLIERYRPDIANMPGITAEEILSLRSDPDLSREMVAHYAEENARYLTSRGFEANPTNVYLAHFLGPAGAVALLGRSPDMVVADFLPANVVAANRSVLGNGRTVGDVIAWAAGKMGQTSEYVPNVLDSIPYGDRVALTIDAYRAVQQRETAIDAAQKEATAAALNDLLVGLHDGRYGAADIATARREWLTDIDDILKAERVFAEAQGEDIALREALGRFADPNETFSSFSADDRNDADRVFTAMGGTNGLFTRETTEEALAAQQAAVGRIRAVVERTGIVPASALDALQGGMYSPDVATRSAAFAVLDGLYRANPMVIGQALTEAQLSRLQDYQALSPTMSPDELQAALDPNRDPRELEREQVFRQQAEDIVREYDDSRILTDLGRELGLGSFMTGRVSAATMPDPMMMVGLRMDYERIFAERYVATRGNEELARQQTVERLQLKWGVTGAGGVLSGSLSRQEAEAREAAGLGSVGLRQQQRIMAYPPELFFQPVNGTYDWMYDAIEEFVVSQFGDDIQGYWLDGSSRETEAGLAGGNPSYMVVVQDRDGMIHAVRAGDLFADYEAARQDALDQFFIDRDNAIRDRRFDTMFPGVMADQPGMDVGVPVGPYLVAPDQPRRTTPAIPLENLQNAIRQRQQMIEAQP